MSTIIYSKNINPRQSLLHSGELAMARGVVKWILYLASAGLIILGSLYLLASFPPYEYRLPIGLVFIIVAVILLYFSREKKPLEIKQTISVSGPIRVKEVRCPNCGAHLNTEKVAVVDGRPFMTCEYCGNNFEVTEEPMW